MGRNSQNRKEVSPKGNCKQLDAGGEPRDPSCSMIGVEVKSAQVLAGNSSRDSYGAPVE